MAGPETDSAKPKPEAAKTSAAGGGDATKYVGTPAVGTSKAAAAAGLATVGPEPSEINQKRRRLVWVTVTGFLGAWFIAFLRFFLPRTLFEPATAAATIVKASISKAPRRVRWIALMWNSRRTVKSSWILPGSTSGPRDNQATSAIRDHFCRCSHARKKQGRGSLSRRKTGAQQCLTRTRVTEKMAKQSAWSSV